MSNEKYFEVISGEDNKGHAYYLIPFDFEDFKVNPYYYSSPLKEDPFSYKFDELYNVKIKTNDLKADFYLLSNLGSEAFVRLLDELNIIYRAIPLNIEMYKKKKPYNNYFLVFITDVLSILDEQHSVFKLMTDKYSNEIIIENGFKKYDEITKFTIDKQMVLDHHLFYCSEIGKLVCSLTFKEKFVEHNLIGVDFKEINNEYKYYSVDPALLKFL